ncbi:arylamine N-acetyltransferase 1 [Leucosporidium creatinivorum]|uniref:Arylamine N-acetyltransferase 1 n=1 Tax=Leucosporidium creatinivorum TaxID=106004 RepID=A0A1Y2G694_9BASI|nr:arylamine N-acetyltransferase 1 [Leucosporidium creatinivorum]
MTVEQSTFPTPNSTGQLSRADAALYLTRIGLPHLSNDASPSLDLLRQLQSHHITHVPFESTSIHVPNWHDDEADIELGRGTTVGLGEAAFRRIVHLKRGGYCFSINSTFALLLRWFGFRVSEVAARVFGAQGKDPEDEEVGWSWSPTSHQCAVVDWEGSEGRWFVDVGFGSAQSVIPFHDNAEQTSLPPSERFLLRQVPCLPITSTSLVPPADPLPYWIVSHWESPPSSSPSKAGYWSPVYAFTLSSISTADFIVYNHYNSTHPSAVFVNFFVCTRLSEDGSRRTLYWKEGMLEEKTGRRLAKLQTTRPGQGDREGEGKQEEWVEMKVGSVKRCLKEVFGMEFPRDYSGN